MEVKFNSLHNIKRYSIDKSYFFIIHYKNWDCNIDFIFLKFNNSVTKLFVITMSFPPETATSELREKDEKKKKQKNT